MIANTTSIQTACRQVLAACDPEEKCRLAHVCVAAWKAGDLSFENAWRPGSEIGIPGRPENPILAPPREVQRRRVSGEKGRIALLHAIAHIEFNAINLAFDMVARFGSHTDIPVGQRSDFIEDWLNVGDDESRHFKMINDRLAELGSHYGALTAHDGLWEAAIATKDDIAARLAIAPLVLEARGLDVTPGMINRLKRAGDGPSAEILETIYQEEIQHVAAGSRWFHHVCNARNREPATYFHELVQAHYAGNLKPPFNSVARDAANLLRDFYEPLAQ
jgi:uncharacterized ferritin-like protein (DUF455 family)